MVREGDGSDAMRVDRAVNAKRAAERAAFADMPAALKEIIARNEIQHWFNLDQARAAVSKAESPLEGALAMDVPRRKQITEQLSVDVASHGWPYWTHIKVHDTQVGLNREEAHDLLYAMHRICEYLDARDLEDRARQIQATK